ncbi:MAG: hypothetical protein H7Z17_12525, partial [Fuerstia sp.]|nr:hypothetical protein [Fuerstiella sp.]
KKAVREVALKIEQTPRMVATNLFLPFIGDIILYQGSKQRIHKMIRKVIPRGYGTKRRPVSIVAHSLGGVIAFDMALTRQRPLWIKHFVTMGSQPGFFHIHDPRSKAIAPFAGKPIDLPATISSWTNIWDRHDYLAFAADAVFRLNQGSRPRDVEVKSHEDYFSGIVSSHGSYWTNPDVLTSLAMALGDSHITSTQL